MSAVFPKTKAYLSNAGNFGSATLKWLLVRSTSTYVPANTHQYVSDFTDNGGVELSVSGYARTTAGSPSCASSGWDVVFDIADITTPALSSGQTVKAAILYLDVGGDDTASMMLYYWDGTTTITLAADAALHATTLYIEPLPLAIPDNSVLDFGGGGTATMTAAASANDRSISVDDLLATRTAGATSAVLLATSLPFATNGSTYSLNIGTGVIIETVSH